MIAVLTVVCLLHTIALWLVAVYLAGSPRAIIAWNLRRLVKRLGL